MSETNTMLREAENKVFVEGIVSEVNFEVKQIDGKDAITGDIVIQVSENEICTLDVFSYKLKKDGSENAVFKGLCTVKDEYKSIAKVGVEEADRVRISGAKIVVNDFYNNAGVLKSDIKVQTNFINRLKAGEELNPKATFEVETFIHKIYDHVDTKTSEVTGYKVISGLVPIYDGKIVPMEFIVKDPEIVQGIESLYEPGQTVRLYGDVNIAVTTTKTIVPVAIGKPKEVINTITTRELIVTGGSEPYLEDNPNSFNVETVKNAMAIRTEALEELKNKKDKKNSGGKAASSVPKSGKTLPF
jgi:hypothetical protein